MERKRKISKPEVERIIMREVYYDMWKEMVTVHREGSNFAEKRQVGAQEDDGGKKDKTFLDRIRE